MNRRLRTDQAPAPVGPYNQATQLVVSWFFAGQIPLDPNTGEIVGELDVAKQTEQVIANIASC